MDLTNTTTQQNLTNIDNTVGENYGKIGNESGLTMVPQIKTDSTMQLEKSVVSDLNAKSIYINNENSN